MVPFLLAAVTLIYLMWSGLVLSSNPYAGVEVQSPSGIIVEVAPNSPASGGLSAGDTILFIDHVQYRQAIPPLWKHEVGEQVMLHVLRDGQVLPISIVLDQPPTNKIIERIAPVIIAAFFWMVSLVVMSYRSYDKAAFRFFGFCQLICVGLLSGGLSFEGPTWNFTLFGALQWLIGPAAVSFHLTFPKEFRKVKMLAGSITLFLIGLVGALPYIVFSPTQLISKPWIITYWILGRSFLLANLLISVTLLFITYINAQSPDVRGKIRLVIMGGIVGFVPVVGLSLLPQTFLSHPIVPYHISFLLLGILPLTYGYAILRHGLIKIENEISRVATQALVYALIGGLYLIAISVLTWALPIDVLQNPILLTLMVIVMAVGFGPLRASIQVLLDKLFYGNSYDFRSVVARSSLALSQSQDLKRLSDQIHGVLKTMRCPAAVVLLPQDHRLVYDCGYGFGERQISGLSLPLDGAVAKRLLALKQPCWQERLRATLEAEKLSDAEQKVLTLARDSLWLPLASRERLRGLIILLPMWGEEWLTSEDLDILATLGSFAAIAFENVSLLDAVRRQLSAVETARAELAESRRRLAEGREAERLHLARELHDGPMQDLHAVRLVLAGIDSGYPLTAVTKLQSQLAEIIYELRDICTQLRPPALDQFGLEAAIRSHVKRYLRDHSGIQIALEFKGTDHAIAGPTKLALYRILQVALNNIAQHARAERASIRLVIDQRQLLLEVEDDGCGFTVPDSWIHLARTGHLGLLGASERAESIDGKLEVRSAPHQGTLLRVEAPARSKSEIMLTN